MQTEDDYWLDVTNHSNYKAKFFDDPTISTTDTVNAITTPYNPKRILEIGCGYGRLTAIVKQRCPDAYVAGIDINPEIIKRAESGPVYSVGNKIKGKWDVIYAITVFQHLPNDKKRAYILQAGKALNKGGMFTVQFIEGDRDNFVDHWVSLEKMQAWFDEAGLKTNIRKGLAHPQWTWVTGTK